MSEMKKAAVLTGLTMLAGGVEVSEVRAATTPPQTDSFSFSTPFFGTSPDCSLSTLVCTATSALSFPQFNASLGTLTGVTFTLDSQIVPQPSDSLVSGVSGAIQVNTSPTAQPIGSPQTSLGTYDITNPPGLSGLVGAADKAFYTGSGNIMVTLSLTCGVVNVSGCEGGVGWIGDNSTGQSETGLTLTYDYSPPTTTPIPSALPLFATGLAGLGLGAWRRRRKQNRA